MIKYNINKPTHHAFQVSRGVGIESNNYNGILVHLSAICVSSHLYIIAEASLGKSIGLLKIMHSVTCNSAWHIKVYSTNSTNSVFCFVNIKTFYVQVIVVLHTLYSQSHRVTLNMCFTITIIYLLVPANIT